MPDLGEIYCVEAAYNWGRMEKLKTGWRGEGPYNIMLSGGIHMVDLIYWLTGLTITEAQGYGWSGVVEGIDDTRVSVFKLSNGGVGKIIANGGYSGQHEHRLRLWGTKDNAEIINTAPVDKTLGPKWFAEQVANDGDVGTDLMFKVMEGCFLL